MPRRLLPLAALLLFALGLTACGPRSTPKNAADANTTGAKITFVELGSTTCIPCKQMQPVMKAIESRYAGQVRVVFHDVMKDKAQAEKYGVQLIPTQVFLDSSGKELLRHQGFFAEASIDTFLRAHGLTPRS